MNARRIPTILALMVTVAVPCTAQQTSSNAPKPAGQRTVVGVITDTLGFPIDSAQIWIPDLKRRVYSSSAGAFRFDDIAPGVYEVAARRLGFLPQVRPVIVGNDGGAVSFELLPIVRLLDPIVTSAARGGLSGTIGDTAYALLPGADIWLIATPYRATSDSLGRFFIDAKPGKYMVQVSHAGYGTRMLSVTVPADSGRRIVAWLPQTSRGATPRDHVKVMELVERIGAVAPSRMKLFTREDIRRMGYEDLLDVAKVGMSRPIDAACPAIIDGGPERIPLWGVSAADLEYVEVYLAETPAPPLDVFNARSSRKAITTVNTATCPVTVYAWLRR